MEHQWKQEPRVSNLLKKKIWGHSKTAIFLLEFFNQDITNRRIQRARARM